MKKRNAIGYTIGVVFPVMIWTPILLTGNSLELFTQWVLIFLVFFYGTTYWFREVLKV